MTFFFFARTIQNGITILNDEPLLGSCEYISSSFPSSSSSSSSILFDNSPIQLFRIRDFKDRAVIPLDRQKLSECAPN